MNASSWFFEVENDNACVYPSGVGRVYVHSAPPFIQWRLRGSRSSQPIMQKITQSILSCQKFVVILQPKQRAKKVPILYDFQSRAIYFPPAINKTQRGFLIRFDSQYSGFVYSPRFFDNKSSHITNVSKEGSYTKISITQKRIYSTLNIVLSSRGLGHHPFTVETRVRIPLALQTRKESSYFQEFLVSAFVTFRASLVIGDSVFLESRERLQCWFYQFPVKIQQPPYRANQ